MLGAMLKLLSFIGDLGGELVKKLGVEGTASIQAFLRAFGPPGDPIAAAFDEHPALAWIGLIAAVAFGFAFGPAIAASLGSAAVATAFGGFAETDGGHTLAVETGLGVAIVGLGGAILDASGERLFPVKFLGDSFNLLAAAGHGGDRRDQDGNPAAN